MAECEHEWHDEGEIRPGSVVMDTPDQVWRWCKKCSVKQLFPIDEVSEDAKVVAAWISTAIKLAERVDRRPIVTKQDRQTAGRLIHPASLKILFDAMDACMGTAPKEVEDANAPVQG